MSIDMSIDRIFLAFMVLCGLAAAAVLIYFPHSPEWGLSPYFWALIPMAAFEAVAFAFGRGAPGSVITVWSRLFGLFIAIGLMMAIPYFTGHPVVQLF
jgi:hypothetical protein